MNEIIFFCHLVCVILFALGALRLGKEALTAWVCLQAIAANLFVLKQIRLFGFQVTCSDVFIIGSILGLNFLQEYFGKASAQKASWICFYAMIFFALMSQIHLFYVPSLYDITHAAYSAILTPAPRLLIASLAVFFIVQQFDLRFFGFLKKIAPKQSLVRRNAVSLVISQFMDTVLFSFFGLYGLVASVWDIILVSFCIKVLIILSMSPFIALSKRVAREADVL